MPIYPTDERETAMNSPVKPRDRKWTVEHLLIFVGVGLLSAIVILLVFFPMTRRVDDDRRFTALEKRIAGLEKTIMEGGAESGTSGSEEITRRLEQMTVDIRDLKSSQEEGRRRLDERTAGINNRMDDLSKEMVRNRPDPRAGAPGRSPAPGAEKTRKDKVSVKKTVKAKDPEKKAENPGLSRNAKTKKTFYHLVKSGETFYSICQTYGISLQKLKDINHFDEKAKIRPGQKIVVGP